jgi:hypothetical protein
VAITVTLTLILTLTLTGYVVREVKDKVSVRVIVKVKNEIFIKYQ